MTKERLQQLNDIRQEIKELEERIAKRRQKAKDIIADSVTSSSEWPYAPHTVIIHGVNMHPDIRLRNMLKQQEDLKAKLVKEEAEVTAWIMQIEDSKTRRVFMYRYIDGLKWQQIEIKMKNYSADYLRIKVHDKYLKEQIVIAN